MRLKEASIENDRAFRCCCCCHVRVGTVMLGCFQVFIHLLAIACMAIALMSGPNGYLDNAPRVLETNESSSDMDTSYYQWDQITTSRDGCLVFTIILCSFVISMMLVYGAVRSRPCFLIPFFCLQVFDFCIHCLTVVGYMTYAPNIKLWILEQGLADRPLFNRMMYMDDQKLQILFVIFFVLVLTVKAYLINMVWMCYKYLQLRNLNRGVVREYTTEPDSEMLLPPKYEEAMKMAPAGPPPPAYTAA